MNRLTKVDGIGKNDLIKCFDCGLETAGADLEHCGLCEHWKAALDRLAAYEDTGLTPEEAAELQKADALRKARPEHEILQSAKKVLDAFEEIQNEKKEEK